MYSSFLTYEVIARELDQVLTGAYCTQCFSTGKDELVMQFDLTNKKSFQLLAKFVDGELFFRFYAAEISYGTRSLKQMKEMESQQVIGVKNIPFERAFFVSFSNGLELVFKGFGRFGNVLLCDRNTNETTQVFRSNISADWNFKLEQTDHRDAVSLWNILPTELKPWFPLDEYKSLKNDETLQRFLELVQRFGTGTFFLDIQSTPVKLSVVAGEGKMPLGHGLQALDAFADKFIYEKLFLQEKQRTLAKIQKDIKHFTRLLTDNQRQREQILTRRSYKELGDIVMTYSHTIKPGVSNAFLTDYYTGNPIRIKLDPNLSAAENAEKYYRKAKNESLELKNVETNLSQSQSKLLELEAALIKTEQALGFKDLRKDKGKVKDLEGAKNLPYKEEIFQDYTIWIGKSAKSNDALLKLAAKNDLWLHARDFAGSHVIVKKKGATFPAPVVDYAAQLAAKNSKGKNQTVVAVVAVERKFVTKGKNAAPGEVKLLKEQIVDAYLT